MQMKKIQGHWRTGALALGGVCLGKEGVKNGRKEKKKENHTDARRIVGLASTYLFSRWTQRPLPP